MKSPAPLVLPYNYVPREYQREFWDRMMAGQKRAAMVWHRRSGKDKTAFNWMILSATTIRTGVYYYFFPTYAQGKKILWDGIDFDGFPVLNHIPKELVVSKNETEMQIKVKNPVKGGVSIIQIVGTDNIDSIVGTNPVGCVFSEYALQDPRAWKFVRPILDENGGWAVFVYTPRGKNHAFDLWTRVKHAEDWYTSLLTVRDTRRDDGRPVIDDAAVESARREGVDEETIQQEYFCSFEGGVQGAYYSKQMDLAWSENRITRVPWEPVLPVYTAWDLGVDDATSIWFYQIAGREIRFVRYLEAQGEGLTHFKKVLADLPYQYEAHVMPHDIEVRELTTGITRRDSAHKLGIRPIRVAPKLAIEEGIEAGRRLFPRCYFDRELCSDGIDALANYAKDYDEKREVFRKQPRHDWASHGADAFRTFAVGFHDERPRARRQERADTEFDMFADQRHRAETDYDPYAA